MAQKDSGGFDIHLLLYMCALLALPIIVMETKSQAYGKAVAVNFYLLLAASSKGQLLN